MSKVPSSTGDFLQLVQYFFHRSKFSKKKYFSQIANFRVSQLTLFLSIFLIIPFTLTLAYSHTHTHTHLEISSKNDFKKITHKNISQLTKQKNIEKFTLEKKFNFFQIHKVLLKINRRAGFSSSQAKSCCLTSGRLRNEPF